VEHHRVEMRQTTACRASGDDPARFLKELRQLRDGAGLGPAELAARAHYPYDRITAAEAGPALPDLPVLSAYVRGCGGTTEEWEERWRSLTSAQTLPLLAARPPGSSTAASAGARIGSISPAAETPDPSIILAALDRVAEGMAVGEPVVVAEPAVVAEPVVVAEPAVGAEPAVVAEPRVGTPTRDLPAVADAPVGASGRTGSALSRSTILVAVVVAICVLVAALAIFA
jgi:nicotinate-nucleotide--dimethylbenzimidazole phosphoribosyltransferase